VYVKEVRPPKDQAGPPHAFFGDEFVEWELNGGVHKRLAQMNSFDHFLVLLGSLDRAAHNPNNWKEGQGKDRDCHYDLGQCKPNFACHFKIPPSF